MNKNAENNSTATATAKVKSAGPGRPKYTPTFPRSAKFSFADFCESNGIDLETGKGDRCTILTLRKFLTRDMFTVDKNGGKRRRPNSLVTIVEGEYAAPRGDSGLGRKGLLFQLRDKATAAVAKTPTVKAASAPKAKSKKVKTVKTDAPVADTGLSQETQAYEAAKEALLAPTPAVTIAPTPDPIAETAPVAAESTPAPEAIAAETAAVAETATAAVS
jgi:hypothetical protein